MNTFIMLNIAFKVEPNDYVWKYDATACINISFHVCIVCISVCASNAYVLSVNPMSATIPLKMHSEIQSTPFIRLEFMYYIETHSRIEYVRHFISFSVSLSLKLLSFLFYCKDKMSSTSFSSNDNDDIFCNAVQNALNVCLSMHSCLTCSILCLIPSLYFPSLT